MIIFANSRVLHARTGFSESAERFLQGLYVDHDAVTRAYALLDRRDAEPNNPIKWTNLKECTKDDVQLMGDKYRHDRETNRVQRVLDMLRAQQGEHAELGAPIDLFTHGLQTATRAHAAGESVDIVVAALLHDIGEVIY